MITVYFFMVASLLVGLLMIFRMRKEDKLYLFLGIGLILLSVWLFVNKQLDGLLSTGVYAWIGRGVLAVVAVVLGYFFWQEEKKRRAAQALERAQAAPEEEPYDPETAVLLKDTEEEEEEAPDPIREDEEK